MTGDNCFHYATEIHFCHNCNLIFVRLAIYGAAGYTCPYGCELYSYPKRACLIRPPPIQGSGSGFYFLFPTAKVRNSHETTKFFFHLFVNFILLLTISTSSELFLLIFVIFMQYSSHFSTSFVFSK